MTFEMLPKTPTFIMHLCHFICTKLTTKASYRAAEYDLMQMGGSVKHYDLWVNKLVTPMFLAISPLPGAIKPECYLIPHTIVVHDPWVKCLMLVSEPCHSHTTCPSYESI